MSEPKQNAGCSLCNPQAPVYRYLILFVACILCIGANYCYDTSGALEVMILKDMDVATIGISKLYASYSYPNVILCFINGFLIDRVLGVRWGGVLFSFLVLIGQNVIALGACLNHFWLMEFGNVIFGTGTESLNLVIYMYIANWFKGKELNMALGLESSITSIVSSINVGFTPAIYHLIPATYSGHTRLGFTIFIIAVPCVFSHISSFVLAFCDLRAENILRKTSTKSGEVVKLSDIKDFPTTFWLITIISMTNSAVYYTFIGLGKIFFDRRYKMTDIDGMNSANTIESAFYLTWAIVSPVLGIMLDKTGRNLIWLFMSVAFTLFSFLGLACTNLNPWIPVVIISVCYPVVFSNSYALVSLEVPSPQLGTAYGILVSANNLLFAVLTMAAGIVIETKGFFFLIILFINILSISLIAAILLFVANASKGGILNMATEKRRNKILEITIADEMGDGPLIDVGSSPRLSSSNLFHSD